MNDHPPLRIINGRVIDPAKGAGGARELFVADGRIVTELSSAQASQARTIDADKQCVMPGAIDMHTHVASRGVAMAEALDEASGLVPAARQTGLDYARLGITTVIDAAVPPAESAFAHDRLDAMPNVDSGFLVEIGNDRELLRVLAREGEAAAVAHLGQLLDDTGALGLKAVNPGLTDDLDAPLDETGLTPRALLRLAAQAVETYDLAHPLHVHAPLLGEPGNVHETLAVIDALADHRLHVAHGQFSAYAAHESGGYASGAETLTDCLATHPSVTMDAGCIGFGPAMMISRDHRLAERLASAMGRRCTQRNGWSVMPMHYAKDNPVNALQWALGLELILRSNDLRRVALSVDHPNGGSFTHMPALMRLLTSRDERHAAIKQMHPWARQRTALAQLDRELSDEALVTLTRAAPARALGLSRKGHLSEGADGDVVIAPRPFETPTVVIKSGEVVFERGQWHAEVKRRHLDRHAP